MANRLKGLAGAMSRNQLAATIRGSAQQIWLAGLGAFSTARKEGNKVFGALVEEGEAIQSLTQKVAKAKLIEGAGKAVGTRRRFEQIIENSVARSFRRFGVPTRKDVDTLSKRLAALTVLTDMLGAEVSRERAAAKRAPIGRR